MAHRKCFSFRSLTWAFALLFFHRTLSANRVLRTVARPGSTFRRSLLLQQPDAPLPPISFDDFRIESVKGVGSINVVFQGKIPKLDDGDYIMKITKERDLHYSDVESKAFELLMVPPMVTSIPRLIFHEASLCEFCCCMCEELLM